MLLWVQGRRLKSSLLSLRRPPCLSSHLQPRGLNRLAPAISSPPPALAQWNTFARTVPASLPVAFAMDWWTTGTFADSNFASRVAKSDPNHFRIPVLRAGQSLPVKSIKKQTGRIQCRHKRPDGRACPRSEWRSK